MRSFYPRGFNFSSIKQTENGEIEDTIRARRFRKFLVCLFLLPCLLVHYQNASASKFKFEFHQMPKVTFYQIRICSL